MTIQIDVSPGELIDKITILQIKSARMTDEAKLRNVRHELGLLEAVWARVLSGRRDIDPHVEKLRAINQTLWDIEDDLRECERAQQFDAAFIALARAVYHTNDQRSAVKRDINALLESTIVEEKSYRPY